MLRPALLIAMALCTLGCGAANNPGQANAEAIARRWVASQGVHDPVEASYHAEPRGGGWSVLIEYHPETPGSHTMLLIDPKGRISEVNPGA
jgi:hypothetical protein